EEARKRLKETAFLREERSISASRHGFTVRNFQETWRRLVDREFRALNPWRDLKLSCRDHEVGDCDSCLQHLGKLPAGWQQTDKLSEECSEILVFLKQAGDPMQETQFFHPLLEFPKQPVAPRLCCAGARCTD